MTYTDGQIEYISLCTIAFEDIVIVMINVWYRVNLVLKDKQNLDLYIVATNLEIWFQAKLSRDFYKKNAHQFGHLGIISYM